METWREMASSSRTPSFELFDATRWRSCASRAYYAVYSEVTHGLLQAGVTMPAGRKNLNHTILPALILNHLAPLTLARRGRLSSLTAGLYTFRIIADYRPDMTLDEPDARIAMGMMSKAFEILQGVP